MKKEGFPSWFRRGGFLLKGDVCGRKAGRRGGHRDFTTSPKSMYKVPF
jgi:hypothetical protein